MAWYVLAIQAARHRKILTKLDDLAIVTLYPQRTIWRKQRSGPRKRSDVPLIPSYVFVELELSARHYRSILSIKGVSCFLGASGQPQACRAPEIDRIRAAIARGDYDETLQRIANIVVGQRYEIAGMGLYGTVTAIN